MSFSPGHYMNQGWPRRLFFTRRLSLKQVISVYNQMWPTRASATFSPRAAAANATNSEYDLLTRNCGTWVIYYFSFIINFDGSQFMPI
jgi:hypothetical protein